MKLFVVVAFLFAAVYAASHDQPEGLSYPLRDFYEYMQCVAKTSTETAKVYGCQAVWEEYRQNYLDTVTAFQDCAQQPTENEADACRYKRYANGERILGHFYLKLRKNQDNCFRYVSLAIMNCQTDDMRYSPDF